KKAFEKKLGNVESVDKPYEPWELRLGLAPSARSGEIVVRLEAAVVERGAFTLGPVDLEVGWGDRLALVGPNGSGKSTLLDAVLALLSARGVNCLVLDEPTNHLDVEAIEELERALAGYEGTVLLVTHDRVFLERFGATRTISL